VHSNKKEKLNLFVSGKCFDNKVEREKKFLLGNLSVHIVLK
jgi:hypothetical protein